MSITRDSHRFVAWWLPLAELNVVALWLVWTFAPPPVSAFGTWWFDLVVVPTAIACLFGVAIIAMWRGYAPRGALAWVGIAGLGIILVLHAYAALIVATFPAEF